MGWVFIPKKVNKVLFCLMGQNKQFYGLSSVISTQNNKAINVGQDMAKPHLSSLKNKAKIASVWLMFATPALIPLLVILLNFKIKGSMEMHNNIYF